MADYVITKQSPLTTLGRNWFRAELTCIEISLEHAMILMLRAVRKGEIANASVAAATIIDALRSQHVALEKKIFKP